MGPHLGYVEANRTFELDPQRDRPLAFSRSRRDRPLRRSGVVPPSHPAGACKVHDEPDVVSVAGFAQVATEVLPTSRPVRDRHSYDRLERGIEGVQCRDRIQIAFHDRDSPGLLVEEADQRFDLGQLGHGIILPGEA
jgi:hypothetical protein